jgi:hypothetical protein
MIVGGLVICDHDGRAVVEKFIDGLFKNIPRG